MSKRLKTILIYSAKLAVTAILLVWVFKQTDTQQLRKAFSQVRWDLVVWVWMINVLAFWVLSYNMHHILKQQGCRAGTWILFAVSAVTALYGLVLPGLVDSSVKWYILKRHTGKGIHVFSGMAYGQITSLSIALFAALGALALTQPTGDERVSLLCVLLMGLLMMGWLLVFHPKTGTQVIIWLRWPLRCLPGWLRNTGNRILDQLGLYQNAPWSFHGIVVALYILGFTVLGNTIYVLAARAAGIEVSIGAIIWVCALVYILSRLPISIANFGWREMTLVTGLGLYGAGPSAAFVMSMVLFSNKLVIAAIGACFQLAWTLRHPGHSVESLDS